MSNADLRSTKRFDLVKRLRQLGWEGPISGGKHQFMRRGSRKLRIPNPHQTDISKPFLIRILGQAGISADEWLGRTKEQE